MENRFTLSQFAARFAPMQEPKGLEAFYPYGNRCLSWIDPGTMRNVSASIMSQTQRLESVVAICKTIVKDAAGKRITAPICEAIAKAAEKQNWHVRYTNASPTEKYFAIYPVADAGVYNYAERHELVIYHANGNYGDTELVGVKTFTPAVVDRMQKSIESFEADIQDMRARLERLPDSIAAYNSIMDVLGNREIMGDISDVIERSR